MSIDFRKIKDTSGQIAASQEVTRAWLAKSVFIGGGVFLLVLIVIPLLSSRFGYEDVVAYITPITTLLGVVLGYYFGMQNGK